MIVGSFYGKNIANPLTRMVSNQWRLYGDIVERFILLMEILWQNWSGDCLGYLSRNMVDQITS